jgi:hypothetical protein
MKQVMFKVAAAAIVLLSARCSSENAPNEQRDAAAVGGAAGGTAGVADAANGGTSASGGVPGTGAVSGGLAVDANAFEAASAPDVDLGGFTVTLVAGVPEGPLGPATPAHTTFFGKVFGAAVPETMNWTVADGSGGCNLLVPEVPYCSFACASDQACARNGTCMSYPTAQDIGEVRVMGLGAEQLIQAGPGNNYQLDAAASLEYPPFAERDTVTVEATGGALGALVLRAAAIAPLVLGETSYAIAAGSPLTLTWTAGGVAAARIKVHLDISHHGGTKGTLECDVADTGSLTIAATLVTKLVALGVAGFPSIAVTRISSGEASTQLGRVTLIITSPVDRSVTVFGVKSCTANSDCTLPQICRVNLTCG